MRIAASENRMSDDTRPGVPADGSRPVEERLRRANEELAFHVGNTPLAVIEWDRDFRVSRWTGQAEAVFGWSAAEVLGKRPFDWRFVHEADAEEVRRVMVDSAGRKTPRSVVINRNHTKAGAVIWCEWHNSVRYDEAGQIASCLSLVLDLSKRRAAEAELVHSEARLKAALSCAQMLSWDWDLPAHRSHYSGDYAAFYGLPADRDYGEENNGWQAVHPDDIARLDRTLKASLESGADLDFEYRGRVPRADGEIRWFATRGQVLRDPQGNPTRVIAVTTDITEQKIAQRQRESLDRQLLDAQKWESLGVLAGGIAHDFNNILTVVLGSAGLAQRFVPAGSEALPYFEQIEQSCRRAADLCRQMLAYAGRGMPTTGRTDLNRLITESAPLVQVSCSPQTRTLFELAPELPPVQADAAQVRQGLLSLAVNAAEAIGDRPGELLMRSRVVDIPPDEPADGYRLPPAPGRYVELSVSDTGSGIPPDVLARMFDPFFTTKFAGRGLGLAAVLGMVRSHRGAVRVRTAPGRGTTVVVMWPPAGTSGAVPRPAARTPAAAPASPQSPRPPRPAALVIDDEMYVREVAASTVEELGYEPLLAADGETGLELFRQRQEAVRVAVIDIVMPGMPGDKLLEELRRINPTLPAVLISGYLDRRAVRLGANTEFVQKPFHAEELAAAVQRVTGR